MFKKIVFLICLGFISSTFAFEQKIETEHLVIKHNADATAVANTCKEEDFQCSMPSEDNPFGIWAFFEKPKDDAPGGVLVGELLFSSLSDMALAPSVSQVKWRPGFFRAQSDAQANYLGEGLKALLEKIFNPLLGKDVKGKTFRGIIAYVEGLPSRGYPGFYASFMQNGFKVAALNAQNSKKSWGTTSAYLAYGDLLKNLTTSSQEALMEGSQVTDLTERVLRAIAFQYFMLKTSTETVEVKMNQGGDPLKALLTEYKASPKSLWNEIPTTGIKPIDDYVNLFKGASSGAPGECCIQ